MITSQHLQGLSTGLGFLSKYSAAQTARAEGRIAEAMGRIESKQLLRNARLRMAQGAREAQQLQREGALVEGSAITQMAASGGGIDPVMLARIKQRADYNSMSAIYDATLTSSQMRFDAALAASRGRLAASSARAKAADIMAGATTTAISRWPSSHARTKPSGMGSGGTFNYVPNKRGYVGGF